MGIYYRNILRSWRRKCTLNIFDRVVRSKRSSQRLIFVFAENIETNELPLELKMCQGLHLCVGPMDNFSQLALKIRYEFAVQKITLNILPNGFKDYSLYKSREICYKSYSNILCKDNFVRF